MTEPDAETPHTPPSPPPAEQKTEPAATQTVGQPAVTPAPPARTLMPALTALALLIMAIAIGLVWQRPDAPPQFAGDVAGQLADLDVRLSDLEQRPTPGPNVPPPPPPAPAAGPDLTPRVEALERRTPPDLGPLLGRIAALEQRPLPDTEALVARIGALEQAMARAGRLTRIQAAMIALAAGRPLGDIPGAPPALAHFARSAPPTEASLRLSFPAAQRAALEASLPPGGDAPILKRLMARVEDLVTVRQGDKVLIGDPAAGVLLRARIALDAGDLTGAIGALTELREPSATALAAWIDSATALRDARLALADMAAQP